jgi:hypothetical protein
VPPRFLSRPAHGSHALSPVRVPAIVTSPPPSTYNRPPTRNTLLSTPAHTVDVHPPACYTLLEHSFYTRTSPSSLFLPSSHSLPSSPPSPHYAVLVAPASVPTPPRPHRIHESEAFPCAIPASPTAVSILSAAARPCALPPNRGNFGNYPRLPSHAPMRSVARVRAGGLRGRRPPRRRGPPLGA